MDLLDFYCVDGAFPNNLQKHDLGTWSTFGI